MVIAGPVQSPQPFGLQNYPFTDIATMRDSGNVFIPPNVFLDARMYPPQGRQDLAIRNIKATSARITITINDSSGEVGQAVVDSFGSQSAYVTVTDTSSAKREIGVLLLNATALRAAVPTNADLSFSPLAFPFLPGVVFPQPTKNVTGIVLEGDKVAYGDIWLIAEDGVSLGVTSVNGDPVISISVVSDPYFLRKFCTREGIQFTTKRPLKVLRVHTPAGSTFNLTPNTYGNVFFRVSDTNLTNIVRIDPTDSGLRIAVVTGSTYQVV